MLESYVDDLAGNGYSFDVDDFILFGVGNKYDWIFALLQTGLSVDEAYDAYNNNIAIESTWNINTFDGVHAYIEEQGDSYLEGMFVNPDPQTVTSAKETFCENIAIYNAMEYYHPGNHTSLSQIIYDNSVNNNLMEFWPAGYVEGELGTNPFTISETMEKYGYNTTEYPVSVADAITPEVQEVVILSSFNDENHKIKGGVHTYCLTAGVDSYGNPCYYSHNAYGSTAGGPYYSVGDYMEEMDDKYKDKPKDVFMITGVDE